MKKHALITTLATVICFTVAGVLVHRYFNPPVPAGTSVWLAGEDQPTEVVRDMTVAEAGRLAGPRYLTARQQHLANREVYLSLPSAPAPENLVEARNMLAPLVNEALRNRENQRAMSHPQLPRDATDRLLEHLAVVFMVAGGLDIQTYMNSLPPDVSFEVDLQSGGLVDTYSRFNLGNPKDDEPREAFQRLYELSHKHRGGRGLARGWPATNEGFILAAGWITEDDNWSLFHSRRLDTLPDPSQVDRAYGFWTGSLAQGALILSRSDTALRDVISESPALLVHVGMIVRSTDDAYPIDVRVWFDPATRRWNTLSVTRRSSIRMGNDPPLVY